MKKRHTVKNNNKSTPKVPIIEPKSKIRKMEPKIKVEPKTDEAGDSEVWGFKSEVESVSPKSDKSTHSIELDHDYLKPSPKHKFRYVYKNNILEIGIFA